VCIQDGRSALSYASEKGHTDVVHLLVKAGANKEAKDDQVRVSDGSMRAIY